jgi:Gluconate 2-dehydrogenase subunit 3
MDRRELLKMIALLTGGVVIGGEVFLTGCKTGAKMDAGFTAANISLLDEIGETIIPTTATPGAKAAKIGELMKIMVSDCYTEKQQAMFTKGISELEDACKKANNKSFMECTPQQRHDFLMTLEKEAKEYNTRRDEEDKAKRLAHEKGNNSLAWKDQTEFDPSPHHYYTMMKQITLMGFFTSKTGMMETLRHVPVPGRYDGAMPYVKGDKAWAE